MKQILYKLFEHQYLGRDEARRQSSDQTSCISHTS